MKLRLISRWRSGLRAAVIGIPVSLASHAGGQNCNIVVEGGAPFCAGEDVDLSVANGPAGTTYDWTVTPNCGTCLVDGNTSTPVFNLPPPSNGSDFTVNLTLTAPGQAPCVATAATIDMAATPSAAMNAAGLTQVDFNGLTVFVNCANPPTLSIDFTDACACTGATSYTIDWGNLDPDSGGPYAPWAETHDYATGLSTITYTVTNATTACSDVTAYGVFLGSSAIPGGNFGNTNAEPVCTGTALEFTITGTANNNPGTQYTVYWGDGTSEVLSSPPPSPIFHTYATSSCGPQSNSVLCGGSISTNSSTNTFLPFLCIETPCNQATPSAGAAQVFEAPHASFTLPASPTCEGNIQFTSNSTGENLGPPLCTPSTLQWSIQPPTGWTGTLTGAATQNINFTPGSYDITLTVVSDICGLDDTTLTLCVESPPVPDFSIQPTSGCAPLNVNVVFAQQNVEDCPEPLQYQWNITPFGNNLCQTPGGFTINDPDGPAPGISFSGPGTWLIDVDLVDPGCPLVSDQQQITVDGPPLMPVYVFNTTSLCEGDPLFVVSGDAVNCDLGNLTIDWTIENGDPATFTGANPGNITFSGTTPGVPNTITIVSSNSCGDSPPQTIDITVDQATAPLDPVVDVLQICPGDPITVTFTESPGITYGWDIPGTALADVNVSSPFTITNTAGLSANNYTINITSDNAGCGSGGASVDFQVQQAEDLAITGPDGVCAGGSVDLSVTGATNPQWTINGAPGPTADSFSDAPTAPSTTYVVTSAGAPGSCPGTDQLVVNVIDYPIPAFTFTGDPCTGVDFDFINTTAGGPFDWSWTTSPAATPPGGITQNFTTSFPNAAPFDVTLSASTQTTPQCSALVTQTVNVVDGPTVDVTVDDIDLCQSSIVVDLQADVSGANLVFNWSTSGGSGGLLNAEDAGNVTFDIVPNVVTIYQVTLSVDNPNDGCGAVSDGFTVTLFPDPTAAFDVGLAPCEGVNYTYVNTSLNASGATWTVDNGPPINTTDLDIALAAGPHDITLTASTNTQPSCTNSITQTVVVEPLPTVSLPLSAIDSCATGLTLDFAATTTGNNLAFDWSFGPGANPGTSTSPQPSGILFPGDPLAAIAYPITVAVDNPADVCPEATAGMTVTVLPFPISIVNTDFEHYCEGDSVLVTQVGEGIIDSCRWIFSDQPTDTVTTFFPDIQTSHLFPLVDVPTDFTITCLVHNPCGVAVDVDTITVIPSDITIATHTDPTVGCAPLTVTFENNTPFDTAQQWFFPPPFGIIEEDTVTLTFTAPGDYMVIARSYACGFDEDTITINVLPSPPASFTWEPAVICTNTPVTFTNTANGTSVVLWDFGGGTTSIDAQPVQLFSDAEPVDVQLTTGWTLNSCTGDTVATVVVGQAPQGAFTFGPSICAPDTVCFDATVTDVDDFAWDFGNISAAEDPCNVFTQPGTFAVSLTLTNNAGCLLQLDTVVVVDTLPSAAFTAFVVDPCHLPAQAVFTDASHHATSYSWDFGSLGSSTATEPPLTLPSSGDFPVALTVQGTPDIPACNATADTVLTVFPEPHALGEVLTDPACSMQPVLFDGSASVNGVPLWSLGDGTTDDRAQFTHLYEADGTYLVQLTILGEGGCTDTLDAPIEVVVHPSPLAAFVPRADGQLSELIHFQNTSTGAERYEWDFGDGSTSTEEHPDHRYNLRADGCDWAVTLVATSAEGCTDTIRLAVEAKVSVMYFMANAFTPNGQGPAINERYRPDFVVPLNVVAQCEYHFTIFDRWGHPLFEATDPLGEWDGNFPDGKPVPQAPYTWAVHLLHPCIPVTFRDREGHVDVVR